MAAAAHAIGIEANYVEIVPASGQYEINASFNAESNERLDALVTRGVTLPFVVEFTLKSPRWYWWDKVIVERTQELRITYQPLTRQYRIGSGGLQRGFASLDEALRALLAIRSWPVVERAALTPGESYSAALRVRLDLSRLPKPFQVAAIGDTELDLSSNWQRWTFLAEAPEAP